MAGCQGLAQETPGRGPGKRICTMVVVKRAENNAGLRRKDDFPPAGFCRTKTKQCHAMALCQPGHACPTRPQSFRQATAEGWPVSSGYTYPMLEKRKETFGTFGWQVARAWPRKHQGVAQVKGFVRWLLLNRLKTMPGYVRKTLSPLLL